MRDWIKNRSAHRAYHHLLKKLQIGDQDSHGHFLRMDVNSIKTILALVGPKITYRDTHLRKAIPAGERLALTLRFLATGNTINIYINCSACVLIYFYEKAFQACNICIEFLLKLQARLL